MKTKNICFGLAILICFSCNYKSVGPTFIDKGIMRFSVGDWECTIIKDGNAIFPLNQFFDSIDYQKIIPVTEKLQIDASKTSLSINIMVFRRNDITIVIDPGLGKDMGSGEGRLMEKLSQLKIDSSEVDYVILTHGHWDHIGGIARSDGKLNFPNAEYFMSETEWNLWTSEEALNKMPENYVQFAKENLPPISDRVTLVNGDEEILNGIKLIPAPGHTPGQFAILISSKNDYLLYLADAMHFSFQSLIPIVSPVFDMDIDQSISTREKLIKLAYDNNYKVFGYHFDFPGVGKIIDNEQYGYEYKELEIENK